MKTGGVANLVTGRPASRLSQTQADEGERDGGQQGRRGEKGDGMRRSCRRGERDGVASPAQRPRRRRTGRNSEVMRPPSLSVEKKSSQNMQRMGATTTWLMAARWICWLSLVGTYA